jgi:hypothetical protein
MLAVDVSLLATPIMTGQSQSIGVIATYLSIIFITGSLTISLLLARQNQQYGFESADKAVSHQPSVRICHTNYSHQTEFLSNMAGSFFGVKALATVHSLPYAMLLWG